MIELEDFDKVEMRVGTVLEVKDNKKSRNPAYVVTIDFGEELGVKKSSAQITALYRPEDLIGKQVVCCVNLMPLHIGTSRARCASLERILNRVWYCFDRQNSSKTAIECFNK